MSADRDSVERLIQNLRAEADIDKREGGFSWDLHRAAATMLMTLRARCEAAEARVVELTDHFNILTTPRKR